MRFPAVIANGMADDRPILLFDMRLIVFLVRARTGKSDLLVQAIAIEQVVDEFTTVIRIDAEQRKGQVFGACAGWLLKLPLGSDGAQR